MDKLETIEKIEKRMNKICREVHKPKRRHNTMQRNMVRLAEELGFRGEAELWIDDVTPERSGKVDVAWYDSSGVLIVAIEIDSSPRQKSIDKLLISGAQLLLWIYYGAAGYNELETHGIIVLQPFPPFNRTAKTMPKPHPRTVRRLGLAG